MANKLEFRTAISSDAETIQQLVQSSFRTEDTRCDWTGDANLASGFSIDVDEINAIIMQPDSAILTAESGGTLVASIGVGKRGALTRLFLLAVDPHRQRGGLGRQVLAYAEDYCTKTWSTRKLGMNALSTRSELISWYMRCGYKKTGELTPFPRAHVGDVALPDNLCFVELEKELE